MPSAIGKRVFAFIQSVRPADPAHILLLLGATFLFIAHSLRWWPLSAIDQRWWMELGSPRARYGAWVGAVALLTLPILVAGAAAGFLCLVPTRRPLRLLVTAVILPALVTLVAIPLVGVLWFWNVLDLGGGVIHSVMEQRDPYRQAVPMLWSNLGPGIQIATAGFCLAGIFALLLFLGRTTLPVRLRFSSAVSSGRESAEDDRRTALFVWMMLCLPPLGLLVEGALNLAQYELLSKFESSRPGFTIAMDDVIAAAWLFPLVLLAMGRGRREALRSALRLPSPKYLGIAALIPAALACLRPLVSYLWARNQWGLNDIGRYAPPNAAQYFVLPEAALLWRLLPALVEEIAWRGYLQPRFIRKYGIVRGIFFVGIVWGAFHFAGDFGTYVSVDWVIIHILNRLGEMVAFSYVLGWLALRSDSVLPAAVAHGVFNISVEAGFLRGLPIWTIALAWAIVGYLLFRYFPPAAAKDETIAGPAPNLEAAT